MRSDVRTGVARARGGVVRSGLQRVREDHQQSERDCYRQTRRQSRQKPETFFAAVGAGVSENSRLCRRGVAEPTQKRGTVARSVSVLFFRSLLWYIETSKGCFSVGAFGRAVWRPLERCNGLLY